MLSCYDVTLNSTPSWSLTEDQLHLCDTVQRFARERLVPLLAQPAAATDWQETVRLAGTLDLGTMMLPAHQDGMAIDHHDLYLVIEQFASGPLERAAELTLSVPALMVLRTHDALKQLHASNIPDYFNGTVSISLSVPGMDTSSVWLLRLHADAPVLLTCEGANRGGVVFADPQALHQATRQRRRVATLGALTLEQVSVDQAALGSCAAIITGGPDEQDCQSMQTWLTETGFYLCALLCGAMQQTIGFALDYTASRHTFRKPLGTHQLVAARLADMLIAVHGTRLFLRALTAAGTRASPPLIRQLLRHVATEAMDVSRECVQLSGGHGYVEGFPPAARFQTVHWFALLLQRIDTALGRQATSGQSCPDQGTV
jgi:alkylation response protein AidB-like acyl-CoA dehydrogenase